MFYLKQNKPNSSKLASSRSLALHRQKTENIQAFKVLLFIPSKTMWE